MPRAQQSKEGAILAFFQSAPLEVATLVMNLAKDALRERQRRSVEAKARAHASATQAPAPKAKAKAAPAKKAAPPVKKRKRVRVRPPRAQAATAHDTGEAQLDDFANIDG